VGPVGDRVGFVDEFQQVFISAEDQVPLDDLLGDVLPDVVGLVLALCDKVQVLPFLLLVVQVADRVIERDDGLLFSGDAPRNGRACSALSFS